MNPVTAKPDTNTPKAQAAAHYASVTEQADELKVQIAQARSNIRGAQRAIEQNEDFIVQAEELRAKLLRKKRIFARARAELEEVDSE
jgi:hypothetical protein